jgi:hypothetical protein
MKLKDFFERDSFTIGNGESARFLEDIMAREYSTYSTIPFFI